MIFRRIQCGDHDFFHDSNGGGSYDFLEIFCSVSKFDRFIYKRNMQYAKNFCASRNIILNIYAASHNNFVNCLSIQTKFVNLQNGPAKCCK